MIWILIGSNWVFKHSMESEPCSELGIEIKNSSELDDNSTIPIGISIDGNCVDCSMAVYQFAGTIIMLQYIIVILVIISCFTVAFRSSTD